jgi:hypothetical protein
MSPLINNLCIFKTASAIYLSLARVRDKRHLLITDVPMGNLTLCCRKHATHRLWVEWASSKSMLFITTHMNLQVAILYRGIFKIYHLSKLPK